MPFIEDKDLQTRYLRAVGIAPDEVEETPYLETMKAAMSLDNAIVSTIVEEPNLPDSYIDNENFNPLEWLDDTQRADPRLVEQVTYADTPQEVKAAIRQYERENEKRQIIANGPWSAGLLAEVFDPINMVPIAGGAYKSYKGGYSVMKGGLTTAATIAGITALEEAALHETQMTRTYGESAVNMAAVSLFGFAFGGAPAAASDAPAKKKPVIKRSKKKKAPAGGC